MTKALLFTLCTLFLCLNIQAQQPPGGQDTPEHRLSLVTSDTARLTLLRQLAIELRSENREQSLQYTQEGIALSRKISNLPRLGAFYVLMGNTYIQLPDYSQARLYLDSAYNVFQRIKDKKGMASTLSGIGSVYQRQSDLVNAIKYFIAANKMAEATGDKKAMFLGTYNIAITYCDQGDGPKALEYAQRAFKLVQETKDEKRLGLCLGTLAEAYRLNGDTLKARQYFAEAVKEYERTGDEYGAAAAYTNWALITGDIRTEMDYQLKAQEYWDRSGTEDQMVVANLGNLGTRYFELYQKDVLNGKYGDKAALLQKAESCIKRSLAMAVVLGNKGYQPDPMRILAGIQYIKGDYKNAYDNYARATTLDDSIFSQHNTNLIARLESQQRIALRDKEISLGKMALQAQKRQTIGLVVLIALLLILGIMFYRQSSLRKKANAQLMQFNRELDDANKLKARFFGMLSHDLRSPVARLVNYLRLQKESPGLICKEAAVAYEEKIKVSAEHLLDTMESILIWSKGQMQEFTPHRERTSADVLFEDIRRHFEDVQGLHISFSDPGHLVWNTDPEFVKTIMRNLTDNAIKAVKQPADAVIEWTAGKKDGRVFFSVKDNGPGATAEQLKTLFDYKAPVIARKGLGFHLVRDMAKAIDCTIEVKSEPGSGTTFYLLF